MSNQTCAPYRNGITRSGFSSELDRVFDEVLGIPVFRAESAATYSPRVNITETKDKIVLTLEVSGISKDDVTVKVKDDLLTISGKRERKIAGEDEKQIRTELRYGQFARSFTIPESVNRDTISADYSNGLLEISLEKREEVKPRKIQVKVS
ncbi:MAG: Hsp20/alpha crystallin family protein [candidate division Zixibacteria bacterium]|nr:Hsp20/alpha crystallin family protein [candidate division Zixibacteria bacterium]